MVWQQQRLLNIDNNSTSDFSSPANSTSESAIHSRILLKVSYCADGNIARGKSGAFGLAATGRPRLDCLSTASLLRLSSSKMYLSKLQRIFVQSGRCICPNCQNNHAKSYRVNFLTALPDGREISPDPRDFPRANHMENLEGRVISVENGKIIVSLCLCLSGHDFVCVSSSGICYKEGLVSTLAVSLSHRRPV